LTFFTDLFGLKPKPVPVIIIRNRLGEEIDRVEGVCDLWGQDLRGRQWAHADLSKVSLAGANCERINLFGARLERTDFSHAVLKNAELSYSYAAGASFRNADLRGCSLYMSQTGWPRSRQCAAAEFDGAMLDEASDVAEHKAYREMKW
jgi:uncharacterized protein YjbI with pentapeptide repeats